jgi:hypothetical protein
MNREVLERLIDKDSYREQSKRLFLHVIDGKAHVCATDARVFLAVRYTSVMPTIMPPSACEPLQLKDERKIDALITPCGTDRLIKLDDLKTFCPLLPDVQCKECLAISARSSHVNCDWCDNTGVEPKPDRYAWLDEATPFDVNRLTAVLHDLPGDSVKLWTQGPERAFYLVGDDWLLIQMAMKNTEVKGLEEIDWPNMPRFITAAPIVGSEVS